MTKHSTENKVKTTPTLYSGKAKIEEDKVKNDPCRAVDCSVESADMKAIPAFAIRGEESENVAVVPNDGETAAT